ncbi:uncharacterized protein EV420DRAFT_1641082 [Desarmillaria tabescens]|uniref:Uncharacterized protein n=1 Tax=Armillaria tabescens TaxID=1929756 RepID=A0AA39N7N3_ARMTA|nr:uncharacterized protein EV420DRAFT_1641082 [Desarmillaria tabescens]KAK0460532.1 hypothetical protein EV420DRAFT_1641082 [Desarmillaria tabescens]
MTIIARISQLRQSITLDGEDSDAVPSSVPLLGPSPSNSLTQSEIALIRECTDALEEESVDVEQNIHFLESLLSRFHRRRDQNRASISFQKSLLVPLPLPSANEIIFLSNTTSRVPYFSAPISLLPVEVIAEILQIAMRNLPRTSIHDTLDIKKSAPWTFCRIFWETNALTIFPKRSCAPSENISIDPSRRLLDVTMDFSAMDNWARPLKPLLRHTHRWSIVDLTLTPVRFQTMASFVGVADFPALKRLNIDVQDAVLNPAQPPFLDH